MREHGLIRLYKRLATPILALVMILGAGWGARPLAAATVDTLYHNGKIYTLTESMREAKDPRKANTVEVVATRDGKIIFAGSAATARQPGSLRQRGPHCGPARQNHAARPYRRARPLPAPGRL